MSKSLLNTQEVKDLLTKVSGLTNDAGNPRLKQHHAPRGLRPVPHDRGFRCAA